MTAGLIQRTVNGAQETVGFYVQFADTLNHAAALASEAGQVFYVRDADGQGSDAMYRYSADGTFHRLGSLGSGQVVSADNAETGVGVVLLDDWSAAVDYVPNNLVLHNGEVWRSLRDTNHGEEPGVVDDAWSTVGSAEGIALVPDAAARLALGQTAKQGTLAVQQDTGWTYRFVAPEHDVTSEIRQSNAFWATTPNDLADIQSTTQWDPFPPDPFDPKNYVVLGDGSKAYFDGTAWQAGEAPGTPTITEDNWKIFSDFLTVQDLGARDALLTHGIHAGTWVGVIDEAAVFNWTGAPNNPITDNGWFEVANIPLVHQDWLQGQVWDPQRPPGHQLHWHDVRTQLQVVDALSDLNDRNLLPLGHLSIGKLVYVRSTGDIYSLVSDPDQGVINNDLTDWSVLATGVKFAARESDLPNAAIAPVIDGEMWIVRMDADGEQVNRMLVWDKTMSARPVPPGDPVTFALDGGVAPTYPASTVTITWGNQPVTKPAELGFTARIRDTATNQDQAITTSAKFNTGTDIDALCARLVALASTDFAGQPVDFAVTATNDGIVLTAQANGEILDVQPVVTSLPAQQGGWRPVGEHTWFKTQRQDPDQDSSVREGDWQITMEAGHRELQVADASGNWQMLFSDDDINTRIASLSLFQGVVQESGGTQPSTPDFSALPDLTTAGADLIAHYWTFTGSAGYTIKAADPHIGGDLDGIVLQPGDWLQVANLAAPGQPEDLHWVRIGGDLLSKTRAELLYGMQTWVGPGGYEKGTLVYYDGGLFKASRDITGADPGPRPPAQTAQITPAGAADSTVMAIDSEWVSTNPAWAAGDWVDAGESFMIATAGHPFNGRTFNQGDRFLFTGNVNINGRTPQNLEVEQGWIYYPASGQGPSALWPTGQTAIQLPAQTPWREFRLDAGLRVAQTDADLPLLGAPPGEVWVVVSSVKAGGIGLFGYDRAAQLWQELGGGGSGLDEIDLSQGTELISVGLPVGAVTAFSGTASPPGWLWCAGQKFDPNTYPELYAVLGDDTAPDLRGQFIRGGTTDPYTRHNWTTGAPRNSFSMDSAGNHDHMALWVGRNGTGYPDGSSDWIGAGSTSSYARHTRQIPTEGNHTHRLRGGDLETAPDHVIMGYIIKARDMGVQTR